MIAFLFKFVSLLGRVDRSRQEPNAFHVVSFLNYEGMCRQIYIANILPRRNGIMPWAYLNNIKPLAKFAPEDSILLIGQIRTVQAF